MMRTNLTLAILLVGFGVCVSIIIAADRVAERCVPVGRGR